MTRTSKSRGASKKKPARRKTKGGAAARQRGVLHGYRSGTEEKTRRDLAERGIDYLYEVAWLSYTIPARAAKYKGDWFLRRDGGPVTYDFDANPEWYRSPDFWAEHFIVETKGRFMPDDRKKHLFIKAQFPMADIRFLFNRAKAPINPGSKTTCAMWCEKKGFLWADGTSVPEEWFDQR